MGWNYLKRGLTVGSTAGPSHFTNSPHPSSREGHHPTAWWNPKLLLSRLILQIFHVDLSDIELAWHQEQQVCIGGTVV